MPVSHPSRASGSEQDGVVGLAAGSSTAAAEARPRWHCQQGAGGVIERGNDPKEWAQAGEPEYW